MTCNIVQKIHVRGYGRLATSWQPTENDHDLLAVLDERQHLFLGVGRGHVVLTVVRQLLYAVVQQGALKTLIDFICFNFEGPTSKLANLPGKLI